MDKAAMRVEKTPSSSVELSLEQRIEGLQRTTDFAEFIILAGVIAHDGKPASVPGGRCDVWLPLSERFDPVTGHMVREKVRLGVHEECVEVQHHQSATPPGVSTIVAYENITVRCRVHPQRDRFLWEVNSKQPDSPDHETPEPFGDAFTAGIDEDIELVMRSKVLEAFLEAERQNKTDTLREVGNLGIAAMG